MTESQPAYDYLVTVGAESEVSKSQCSRSVKCEVSGAKPQVSISVGPVTSHQTPVQYNSGGGR